VGPASKAAADPTGGFAVTVVHTETCHFCDDAIDGLRDLTDEYRLRVTTVPADSPEGQRLVRTHGTGMFPLILVDGQFFSQGRLPRRKMRTLLDSRPATAGVA
jgi:hypothetical protein